MHSCTHTGPHSRALEESAKSNLSMSSPTLITLSSPSPSILVALSACRLPFAHRYSTGLCAYALAAIALSHVVVLLRVNEERTVWARE